jgi:uncharacterized protein
VKRNVLPEVGRFNTLAVSDISGSTAYFATSEGDIPVPLDTLPPGTVQGDTVTVFVYRDTEDRLAATTIHPKIQVGEFALLEVTAIDRMGAFLDWGLKKELLVPFAEQPTPFHKGERHLVAAYLDISGRVAASAKIGKFLETGHCSLQEGEEVDLMIWDYTPLGAKVIINGSYGGLLFRDELFTRPLPGSRMKGYVRKIREDSKIDVTLKKQGRNDMDDGREKLMQALTAAGGFLPLCDKSPPEQIGAVLSMSKKTFKKVVGNLYKEGLISLDEEGITLRNK